MPYHILFEARMSALISLTLLAGALYVILSGSYDQETQKWAFGILGLVAGVWLKRDRGENRVPFSSPSTRRKHP